MAGVYRPRHSERTVLYRALFHHFDRFLAEYESRFEREYGFFRFHVRLPFPVTEGGVDEAGSRSAFRKPLNCPKNGKRVTHGRALFRGRIKGGLRYGLAGWGRRPLSSPGSADARIFGRLGAAPIPGHHRYPRVRLHLRSHLPIILPSGLMDQPFAVPWWDGLSLRLTARDALKPLFPWPRRREDDRQAWLQSGRGGATPGAAGCSRPPPGWRTGNEPVPLRSRSAWPSTWKRDNAFTASFSEGSARRSWRHRTRRPP
jgi:hypothetical protein